MSLHLNTRSINCLSTFWRWFEAIRLVLGLVENFDADTNVPLRELLAEIYIIAE